MIVISDIRAFIKNSDDFVLQNPRKTALYSIAFKIIGLAFLVLSTTSMYLAILSICFFSASVFIDHKILKNFEPLFFMFIEKCINRDPDRAGFYMGRIFAIVMQADPQARFRGMYRGFFFQRSL